MIFIYCITFELLIDNHHFNLSIDNSIIIFIYCIVFKFLIDNHHFNASNDNSIINRISFCSHIIFFHNLLFYVYNMFWTCDLILIIFILFIHFFFLIFKFIRCVFSFHAIVKNREIQKTMFHQSSNHCVVDSLLICY